LLVDQSHSLFTYSVKAQKILAMSDKILILEHLHTMILLSKCLIQIYPLEELVEVVMADIMDKVDSLLLVIKKV